MLINDKEMSGPVIYNLPYYCTTVNYYIFLTKKLQGKSWTQTNKKIWHTTSNIENCQKKKSSKEKKRYNFKLNVWDYVTLIVFVTETDKVIMKWTWSTLPRFCNLLRFIESIAEYLPGTSVSKLTKIDSLLWRWVNFA